MSTLVMSALTSATNDAGAEVSFAAWSEEKLLVAAKSGQPAAFGELYERHAAKILRVTHRITRNREDAEDSMQDSFLSAYLHLEDFDRRSRFATWLTRIAINSALAKLRKKRGIREVPMDEPSPTAEFHPHYEVPDNAPNPEESYRLQERKKLVTAAIGGLRPRVRKVVEFHQLQEHSLKETARTLGISATAVKARMFHARAALRRMPVVKTINRSSWASAG
jgi:RNA polymerase sigma factor (sigma-70 family)